MNRRMVATRKLVMSAVFIALGLVLPFITMQIPRFGNMLLPMHIPVLLCGFLCGAPYGLLVGAIVPVFRSLIFGMPMMMPMAVGMAFELAAYGFLSGLLYDFFADKRWGSYISLLGAMLGGRIVWGVVSVMLYSMLGNTFTWQLFMAGAIFNAIPGIIIQLVLIPVLVNALAGVRTTALAGEV